MKAFDKLPEEFQNDEVRQYYDILSKKQASVIFKRAFDLFVSVILLIFLIIPIAVIAIAVKCDSKGPVMFRQERVTKYGRRFKIFKFRTMVVNAESLGTMVTTDSDSRVTRIGRKLRKYRLDELPQVFNVLSGSMTVVGTRPEVPPRFCFPRESLRSLQLCTRTRRSCSRRPRTRTRYMLKPFSPRK